MNRFKHLVYCFKAENGKQNQHHKKCAATLCRHVQDPAETEAALGKLQAKALFVFGEHIAFFIAVSNCHILWGHFYNVQSHTDSLQYASRLPSSLRSVTSPGEQQQSWTMRCGVAGW